MQHFKQDGVGEQGTGFSFPMTGWPGPAAQGLFASVCRHGRFGFRRTLPCIAVLGCVGLEQFQQARVPIAFELREPACAFAERAGTGSVHAALRMGRRDPPPCVS